MQNLLLVLFTLTLFGCATERRLDESNEQLPNEYTELVWSDEFEYSGLPDTTRWAYSVGDGCPDLCGWGNNELQYYTKDSLKNARVEDGKLILEVHEEEMGSQNYTSAKLTTKGKQDWKYGRFEIRAKVAKSKGTWSAIWMLPTTSKYGIWPKSGEIDIMEHVGYDPDTVEASAHTGAYYFTIGTQKHNRIAVPDCDEVFHTYALEWEADEYRVYIDDVHYFTFENEGSGFMEWPFDQRFHLILNVAYGGNWGAARGLEPDKLPQRMEIDYVRVYQKNSEKTVADNS